MSIDRSPILARRALIHAGAAAAGAAVAASLVVSRSALSADGDTVKVGGEYDSSSPTLIAQHDATADSIVGMAKGGVGVRGESIDGNGLLGSTLSAIGAGVLGTSDAGIGVVGSSSSDHLPGVYGSSTTRTGVVGLAGAGVLGVAPANTGVYGVAGSGTTGDRGVHGAAATGRGVVGETDIGIGGYFTATGTGAALQAAGRVKFSTCGIATVAAGSRSVTVDPGLSLSSGSRVLATLQGDPGNNAAVQRVAVNTVADTFVIYLTAKAAVSVKVAWFVIG